MVAFARPLALGGLLAAAAAVAHARFAAVETGAVLEPPEYMSPGLPIEKRQSGCQPGHHPCYDIGPVGANICCPNNQYCVVNATDPSRGACCHIGARCSSPCRDGFYPCNTTSTVTLSGNNPTSSGSGTGTGTVTADGILTSLHVAPACCARTCTSTSMYLCPAGLGTGCCAYTAACASGGLCLATRTPSPETDGGAAATRMAPPGCETGQRTCPASLGGGCCAATQACTLIGERAHCAEVLATPTGDGVSIVDTGGSGSGGGGGGLRSAGAQAGVAVGVVVGCGLIIGAVTWWVIRRRRKKTKSNDRSEGDGSGRRARRGRGAGLVGRVVGGGAGSGPGAGGGTGTVTGREMSEESSDMLSRSGRLAGLAQDYFGPAPAVGPYSETHSTSAVTTPGLDRGGVPVQPHEPGDIAVPVEIDSRLRDVGGPPAANPGGRGPMPSYFSDDGQERYELYGSEVGQISPTSPSPYGMPSPPDERPR